MQRETTTVRRLTDLLDEWMEREPHVADIPIVVKVGGRGMAIKGIGVSDSDKGQIAVIAPATPADIAKQKLEDAGFTG